MPIKRTHTEKDTLDVIIIGAGPFGISLAAHAVANDLNYKLFGYPMDFWKNQMPQNMFIRTPHDFVSFSDPKDEWTIHRFADETETEIITPLPRTTFVQYGIWFAEKAGVEFTPKLIHQVELTDNMEYRVQTETGSVFYARNVIVATGVEHYKYVPEILNALPSSVFSHPSGYTDFNKFQGQKVAVLGSGQSAWEAAGLLHIAGAESELLYRRDHANYGGSYQSEIDLRELGNIFYELPIEQKSQEWGHSPGSVAHFLRPYVEGKVPELGGVQITSVSLTLDGRAKIDMSTGESREFDHIISATGFHINLDRVPFLNQELREQIEREDRFEQFPKVDEHFQSNLSGLYFAGPLSSHSHGPTFRFILGLKKTALTIIPHLLKRQPVRSANI
ncbi:NAD(P)-binding domain-containing protein [Tumebacillus sp. ITR2]|uniref:L-lysine N6-monooxygenase MbtG n=1 Tax=Tumebacillus amylolyticus TaxID=2801339 RepID=A0ABS1J5S3_9BACL|nr:NAD(P)-binding domain-containing protein [Tumebacillus amylolyticus]MBL0385604.1 NAD(P)-binding domain-containing protein [Tumebacillus amylolyticus]